MNLPEPRAADQLICDTANSSHFFDRRRWYGPHEMPNELAAIRALIAKEIEDAIGQPGTNLDVEYCNGMRDAAQIIRGTSHRGPVPRNPVDPGIEAQA